MDIQKLIDRKTALETNFATLKNQAQQFEQMLKETIANINKHVNNIDLLTELIESESDKTNESDKD